MQVRRVRHGTVIVLSAQIPRFELKDTDECPIEAVTLTQSPTMLAWSDGPGRTRSSVLFSGKARPEVP